MSDKPTPANAAGIFEPFHIDRVPTDDFSHGQRCASRFSQLGEFGGAAHVGVRQTGEGYRKSATMEYWDDQST